MTEVAEAFQVFCPGEPEPFTTVTLIGPSPPSRRISRPDGTAVRARRVPGPR